MLDLNRVVGIAFHSRSHPFFQEVREMFIPFTARLEADDVAIIFDDFVQGSGPATAAMNNAKKLDSEEDFIDIIKSLIKEIGAAELNSPKLVLIITDEVNEVFLHTVSKMRRINTTFDYPTIIKVIQVHPTNICENNDVQLTIVPDTDALLIEVANILEGVDVV